MKIKAALLLALSLLTSAALAQGDVAAGQTKAVQCAACHGADGNSANPEWPKLAGQHSDYIYAQLMAFKSGERQNALMAGQVAGLNEADMKNLGAYYATLTMTVEEANPALVEKGEQIYRAGISEKGVPACTACHGPAGAGIAGAGFPRVGGQHATYLANQLKAYRAGERGGAQAETMNAIAAKLDDAEIEALASYMSGLYTE